MGLPLCCALWNVDSPLAWLHPNWICHFHHISWISGQIISPNDSYFILCGNFKCDGISKSLEVLHLWLANTYSLDNVSWQLSLQVPRLWRFRWYSLCRILGQCFCFSLVASVEKMDEITLPMNKGENPLLAREIAKSLLQLQINPPRVTVTFSESSTLGTMERWNNPHLQLFFTTPWFYFFLKKFLRSLICLWGSIQNTNLLERKTF